MFEGAAGLFGANAGLPDEVPPFSRLWGRALLLPAVLVGAPRPLVLLAQLSFEDSTIPTTEREEREEGRTYTLLRNVVRPRNPRHPLYGSVVPRGGGISRFVRQADGLGADTIAPGVPRWPTLPTVASGQFFPKFGNLLLPYFVIFSDFV